MELENGDEYVGQFHDGLFHGSGQYRYSNGDVYVGEFDNGREAGGQIIKSDGSRHDAVRDTRGNLLINKRSDNSDERINYLIETPSNWDDWFKYEMEQFEASMRADEEAVKSEQERFEEWKKNN